MCEILFRLSVLSALLLCFGEGEASVTHTFQLSGATAGAFRSANLPNPLPTRFMEREFTIKSWGPLTLRQWREQGSDGTGEISFRILCGPGNGVEPNSIIETCKIDITFSDPRGDILGGPRFTFRGRQRDLIFNNWSWQVRNGVDVFSCTFQPGCPLTIFYEQRDPNNPATRRAHIIINEG